MMELLVTNWKACDRVINEMIATGARIIPEDLVDDGQIRRELDISLDGNTHTQGMKCDRVWS